MCVNHYHNWRKAHPEEINNYSKLTDPIEKLHERTFIDERGCWNDTRSLDSHGYTRVWYEGKSHIAYRLAYTMVIGPIPTGLVLDHLCENPKCWKPRHLEPVTQRVNMHRGHNSVASRNARRITPDCVCWDRTAPSCPFHGQLHWIDNWAELIAEVTASRMAVAA